MGDIIVSAGFRPAGSRSSRGGSGPPPDPHHARPPRPSRRAPRRRECRRPRGPRSTPPVMISSLGRVDARRAAEVAHPHDESLRELPRRSRSARSRSSRDRDRPSASSCARSRSLCVSQPSALTSTQRTPLVTRARRGEACLPERGVAIDFRTASVSFRDVERIEGLRVHQTIRLRVELAATFHLQVARLLREGSPPCRREASSRSEPGIVDRRRDVGRHLAAVLHDVRAMLDAEEPASVAGAVQRHEAREPLLDGSPSRFAHPRAERGCSTVGFGRIPGMKEVIRADVIALLRGHMPRSRPAFAIRASWGMCSLIMSPARTS